MSFEIQIVSASLSIPAAISILRSIGCPFSNLKETMDDQKGHLFRGVSNKKKRSRYLQIPEHSIASKCRNFPVVSLNSKSPESDVTRYICSFVFLYRQKHLDFRERSESIFFSKYIFFIDRNI